MPSEPKHTLAARQRVLGAFNVGRDWLLVADPNGIPITTARQIVERGSPEVKQRGGVRPSTIKCTPAMEETLIEYVEEDCLLTSAQLQRMLEFDFNARVEPSTCNNVVNIEKRRVFAEALLKHDRKGVDVFRDIYQEGTTTNDQFTTNETIGQN
ncbi:hypothetical protein PHMEG_00019074 [Phytophthora megakarya]|uniref:Uncharacterized protein n=1 Tax=Phytophthora megakarya TaxID=4795 RepID=A0A225VST0_9STRA|nr:hypothetical protein PHMEG_00019074 [Phytophthora megakarya]